MVHRVVYTRLYDSEVEYLESTGTQYLNLGHIPWDKEILFETQTAYTRKYGVGREGSSNALYMGYNENRYETAWMTYYGTLDDNYHIISKKLSYKDNPQKLFSYIDGVEVFRYDMNIEKDAAYAYDLLVFAICGLDGPGFYMCCKKKSFKVIVDGVIVHDLIPVRKGNIGYMYDKVSGKLFGNQGTGNFILGQDVANPVPKIRNVIYYSPYDAEVEYLESTGTQWIDTLYKMTLSDEIRTKVYHLENDSMCAIFGSRGAATNNFYQFYINETLASQVAFGQSTPRTIQARIPSYQVNGMNEIIFKDGLCICNGSSTQIPVGTENSLQNLAIFARRNQDSSVSYHMIMKLYYFQIYHNGTLVRDFIPVRKGLTGYLYDKVSKQLFSNKGTGNFILGPDIANTSPNIGRVFQFDNKRFVAISND